MKSGVKMVTKHFFVHGLYILGLLLSLFESRLLLSRAISLLCRRRTYLLQIQIQILVDNVILTQHKLTESKAFYKFIY